VTDARNQFMSTIFFAFVIAPMIAGSFAGIEYNEMGLLKRKSTGKLKRGKVYGPGNYGVGMDMTFKKFASDVHFEYLEDLSLFSGDKLETFVNFAVEYRIVKENLQELHDQYEMSYETVVRSKVIDSIKNSAVTFQTPMFFQNRTYLEEQFKTNCVARIEDETTGFGGQIKILDLHMLDVRIPATVASKQLTTATQLLDNMKAQHITASQVYRKKTEKEVQEIDNTIAVARSQAEADAYVITEGAQANAVYAIESARFKGLKYMYEQLGLTGNSSDVEGYKASLDYVLTLLNHEDVDLHVNYDTKIATFED